MKGLIVLFVLAVVSIIGYFKFMNSMDSSSQTMLTVAFGNCDKGACDLHVAVQPLTVKNDPPRIDLSTGFQYWDEWLETHYILTEDGGDRVKFERIGQSSVFGNQNVGGAPDFFLRARVKHNVAYTFDFVPVKDGPHKYRRKFTAPAGEQKMSRDIFTLVKE